jgi:hypothetical protein
MNPKVPEYENRIRSQISQYANPEGLLKLGPIYHYWINKHIRPRISAVFGVSDARLFYAQYAAEALPSLARGDESLAWAGDSGFTKQLHVSICEKSRTLDNLDPFLVSR